MKRYVVNVKNAKDCRTELTFLDLCVKYSNGFAPTLKVKEGDEIPLEVCDPEDIRKSLIAGSLKAYLENGWIEEIIEEVKPILTTVLSNTDFITEQDVNKLPTQNDVPPQQILPEVQVVDQPVSLAQNESITDLNLVHSYEDFCRLSHFLKLRWIKENCNIDLLRDISSKTSSQQFKNNITLRLSQIKI